MDPWPYPTIVSDSDSRVGGGDINLNVTTTAGDLLVLVTNAESFTLSDTYTLLISEGTTTGTSQPTRVHYRVSDGTDGALTVTVTGGLQAGAILARISTGHLDIAGADSASGGTAPSIGPSPSFNTLLTVVTTETAGTVINSTDTRDRIIDNSPGGAFRDGIFLVARRYQAPPSTPATYTVTADTVVHVIAVRAVTAYPGAGWQIIEEW